MNYKELNIVSFNVPFPANYGGVIDVFYKIKALHHLGVKIHLHCFDYGRGIQPELEKYCVSVKYYQRNTSIFALLSSKPYIVKSRANKQLLENLLKNDYPILFEGLHTCFWLNHHALKKRIKIVRAHNVEHDYYAFLAKSSAFSFKKLYYQLEAKALKRFEPILQYANGILSVSKSDEQYFKTNYPEVKATFLPCFHHEEEITIKDGMGTYVLYHGNLSVQENEAAALFIVKQIFSDIKLPLKIAGFHPSKRLKKVIQPFPHIELIEDPNDEQMASLIENAQTNILITHQPTGLKLKLLHTLFKGRHCLVNPLMIAGTGLDSVCEIADTPQLFKQKIAALAQQEIDAASTLVKRYNVLGDFTNLVNAKKIIEEIQQFNTTTD